MTKNKVYTYLKAEGGVTRREVLENMKGELFRYYDWGGSLIEMGFRDWGLGRYVCGQDEGRGYLVVKKTRSENIKEGQMQVWYRVWRGDMFEEGRGEEYSFVTNTSLIGEVLPELMGAIRKAWTE
jgi:hypothetical protein